MATKRDDKETDRAATTALAPTTQDIADLTRLFAEGFSEEKTVGVGDPALGKLQVFFGELLGPAGSVIVEAPGAKPDPETGEVKMHELPVFAFHPLDPRTFQPIKQATYSVICSHDLNATFIKFGTLAKARSEETGRPHRAQILIRWNGLQRTRKGNMRNDYSYLNRIVPVGLGASAEGFRASGTGAAPDEAA